jgi:rhamnose transport system permease protein
MKRELSVALALVLLLGSMALFAPSFYQLNPLLSLAAREAPALMVTCGMGLIIIARQIDISVGSQFAVCSVCSGLLFASGWPITLVFMACIGLGLLLGAFNGVFVAFLRLPSIVVTLATMVSWREALRWQRQGQFVNLPPRTQWFGLSQTAGQMVIILTALAVLIALALAARHLATGRFVYAVGSNIEAARLAGLRPQRVLFCTFVFLGALTGAAAVLNTVQSPQVDPKSGTGLEMKSIAAVVVGGIAISGGRGNLWGAALGLVLLACISPALTHLHLEPYWERAVQGAIILLAVIKNPKGESRKKSQIENPNDPLITADAESESTQNSRLNTQN